MGRKKGSKNKASERDSFHQSKLTHKEEQVDKTEVFAISVLETPLFLCRSCRCSFETTEEYAQHQCAVHQVIFL